MVANVVTLSAPAQATAGSINNQINFQGRLLNAAGAVVADGNYNMQFKIYKDGDGAVAGDTGGVGGTLLWTEAWLGVNSQAVTVKNGYFSVNLGSITSLTGVDFNQSVLWLSQNVAGGANATSASCGTFAACNSSSDPELLPMRRMASAVYALQANSCTTCILQAPTSTAQNTISPVTSGVTALTVNGTNTGTAATALSVVQTGAATALTVSQSANAANLAVTNTGATNSNLLTVTQSTSAYTGTAILVNLGTSGGSFASGAFVDLQSNGSSKFKVDNLGVLTLAGAQAADITTLAGTAPTALVFQPGSNSTATSTGASFTLQAGNDTGATASTGGLLTLKGGNATGGGQVGGGVTIDSGTGTTGGIINIGNTNAASINIGKTASNIATTISGTTVIKPTSGNDSATAFQVQNASSVADLNVNTTLGKVTVSQGALAVNGLSNPATPTLALTSTGGTLANATTYTYLLAATSGAGETQAIASSPVSTTTANATSLNTITWSAVTNATGYKLYRSIDGGTTWFVNTLGLVTSAVDNGSNFTWATSPGAGFPAQFANDTGDIFMTAGASLVLDAGGNGTLKYNAVTKTVSLSSAASGGIINLQADSYNIKDATGFNEFQLANAGAVTFRNRTDSGNGFQVKNSGNTSVFNIDTSGGAITVGVWNGTAIGATYGGTGQTSYAVGDLLYASTTTALSRLADIASGSCLVSGGVGVAPSWTTCPGGAAGAIIQVPTTTGTNTISPTAASVVGLTVNGSNNATGAVAVDIQQIRNFANLTTENTGATNSSLLSVSQSTSAYTGTAILVNLAAGSGTFASGAFLDLQSNGTSKFKIDNLGALTLAGAQAADITTLAGTAPTALVFQPGSNSTATSTGASFTLQAGNDTGATASTGGLLTLKGGNATGGGQVGGGVTIDSGTGTTGGTINMGTANAATIQIGSSALGSGTQTINIANSNTAGGTQNVTIGTGSSAAGGTTTVRAKGALTFTGGAASTWDIGANTLSVQTTNNGAITTGTGLLTQGGNVTFSGTTARTITGPTTGGLTINDTTGNLTVSTTTSGTLAVSSAGALNLTGAAASTLNVGGNTLTVTSGGTSAWTNTSGNLTVSTVTSGNITVDSVGTLALNGTNFDLATTGVLTLAGAQAADITTLAGTAPTALVFQPGSNSTATSTGAAFTLQAGNDTGATASTGGLLTLKGGNATGAAQVGGGVTIDSGTGTTGGAVSLGTTSANSVGIGRSGKTTTNNGALTVTELLTANGGTTLNKTLTVNSGGTQNVANITYSSPADSSGTNISQGLNITPVIGNATAGTNTANIFNIGAVTGDAQVTLNGINVGALTGTLATEYAINIGGGWDDVLRVNGNQVISGTGVVAVAAGGTGQTSYTAGDLLYASAATTVSKLADVATGSCLTSGGVGVAPAWATTCALTSLNNLASVNINTSLLTSSATIDVGTSANPFRTGYFATSLFTASLDTNSGVALKIGAANATSIQIGDNTNNTTFSSTGEPTLNGTAQHSRTVVLAPEYAGATMSGTGGANAGNMTSDFCSASGRKNVNPTICPTAGDEHNYYSWTPTVASPAQTYDIYVRYQMPSDLSSYTASSLKVYGFRTGSNDSVTVSMYQANNTLCGSATNVATGTATWTQTTITTSGCTFAANDTITFKIVMSALSTSDFARVGELQFDYSSKW